jgi:Chlorophyll A-B binding protein
MKLSIALLSFTMTMGSASAFTSPSSRMASLGLRMSTEETVETTTEAAPAVKVTPTRRMSEALPWMECSPALDGTMVGDVGFDPLGFAKTKYDLINYREAEIKHARLAMLVRTTYIF